MEDVWSLCFLFLPNFLFFALNIKGNGCRDHGSPLLLSSAFLLAHSILVLWTPTGLLASRVVAQHLLGISTSIVCEVLLVEKTVIYGSPKKRKDKVGYGLYKTPYRGCGSVWWLGSFRGVAGVTRGWQFVYTWGS
jgi:hypothetical protein